MLWDKQKKTKTKIFNITIDILKTWMAFGFWSETEILNIGKRKYYETV